MNALETKKTHTASLLQLIFNALFLLGAWGIAFMLAAFGLVDVVTNFKQEPPSPSIFSLAMVVFTIGLVFAPSLYYSWLRLRGKPVRDRALVVSPFFAILFALWPVLVYVGVKLPTESYSRLILLPIIHILSVVIPIFGLLWLGCQHLVTSSHQRNAGLLGSGVLLGTSLSMIIETLLLIFGFIVLVIVIVADPQLGLKLSHMADRINSANMDPDAILRIISPALNSPITWAILLGFISVATPLIEEICKPIGLWFFARRGLTPRDGFISGMLSGAAFALVETLFNGMQDQPDAWLMIVTLRIGTGALHIFASGLMGYSMAKAWSTRNYWNLFFGYLISVSLHGLWNAMAITLSLTQAVPPEQGSLLESLGKVSPYGMAVLAFLFIFGLYFFNRKLRTDQTVQAVPLAAAQVEG